MAVLTYSEIANLAQDRAQVNVSTDAPFGATELARYINDALADVYEISGGRIKKVTSASAWESAQNAEGILRGLLTDIKEVSAVFATSVAPQALSCGTTNNSASVTSAALFGSVVAGMAVSGTGIPTGAYVKSKTDSSTITISVNATATGSPTLTFSPIGGPSDKALDPVDMSYLRWLRGADGMPVYSAPKVYALMPLATDTPADVGLLELHYWPSVTGFYFPIHYVRTFTPIDASTVTIPDVVDIESRDVGLLAGMRLAQGAGRSDLVPGILMDISERTAKAMERKLRAMISGDQDA